MRSCGGNFNKSFAGRLAWGNVFDVRKRGTALEQVESVVIGDDNTQFALNISGDTSSPKTIVFNHHCPWLLVVDLDGISHRLPDSGLDCGPSFGVIRLDVVVNLLSVDIY
jgi:hypothetical protein